MFEAFEAFMCILKISLWFISNAVRKVVQPIKNFFFNFFGKLLIYIYVVFVVSRRHLSRKRFKGV